MCFSTISKRNEMCECIVGATFIYASYFRNEIFATKQIVFKWLLNAGAERL